MVSSFSNPGFPPVHTHPTRLPAMDARKAAIASIEAMRAELRDIRDSALADLRKAVESAVAPIRRHLALLRHDLALGAGDGSDPAPMSSDDAEIPDPGHNTIPRVAASTDSVPLLLSSSPLLRALAHPPVKPQSNSNASRAAHSNNSKPFSSNQEVPTSVQGLGFSPTPMSTINAIGDSLPAPLLLDGVESLDIDHNPLLGVGIHDGEGRPRRIQCPQRIEFPRFSIKDDPFSWISRAEQFFAHFNTPASQTVEIALSHLNNEALQRFCCCNGIHAASRWEEFTRAFCRDFGPSKIDDSDEALFQLPQTGNIPAATLFVEMPKRECEIIRGTYFEFIFSLKDHREINFGALAIDLHADLSVYFTSNLDFRLVWDPKDTSAKAVKLMLYLQCKDGKRMGTKQSCFCSRQCGGDWHHEAMPSLVSWLVVRWVRTWEPPHESQYKLHNDKGEKHMNNPFDIQRLLQKLVVSWYIRYCYFAQLPTNNCYFAQLPTNNVAACSTSMTFWMNWEFLLSVIWVLSAASPALFIVGQVDGSFHLMFGNRETLLYEIERYKESTLDEQLGCLATQLHCSEFNLGTNNEINWAQEQKGACVIVALFLIVGINVSIVQESSLLQHMVETLGLLNSFKSFRWMHQLQTTESKLMDQESETHNRPPSSVNLSVCVWGDVDCIEVCDIREWPPTSPLAHKLGKVVILREESYSALGKAYEEDGQLHQALQVIEFACSVYGSMPQHLEDTNFISSMSSCFSSPTKFSCTIKKTTSSNSDFSLETIAVCTLTELVLKLEEIQPSKVVANKATTHATLIMVSTLQLGQSLVLPHLIDNDSQDRIVLCIQLICHKGEEVRKILLKSFRHSIVKMLADKQLWETKESKAKAHILIAPPHDLIDFYHLKGRKGMSQFELEAEVQDDLKRATRAFTKVNNDTNKLSRILQLTRFSDKLNIVEQTVGTIRTVAHFTGDKQAIGKYNQFFILTLRTRLFLRGRQCYDPD